MIHLILFTRISAGEKGAHLENALEKSHPGWTVLRNIPDLKMRLQQFMPYEDSEIFVVLAESKDCLLELFELEKYLNDKRLILVLPDGQKNTVSIAHRLQPRFIYYIKDDYRNLCAVIGKMALRTRHSLCGRVLHGRKEST